MYSLYDMAKLELLIKDESEEKIYKTICNRFKISENQRLMVTTRYKNGDVIVCAIRNQKDFVNYLKDYEYRLLTGKSCVELKREMLDIKEKPKVKTYKLPK